ncbi:hypothetical protein AVEN_50491-1 [Araneus ventricosus]|uniref:Uncharacterized protein n=1 Tax=Araneus ventricosus TaxID=182803 RepID=A0A4Y2APN9_ARAVE|nr:hypothetical protein AVEN_50491-1 [Araneus ventricosus]
MEPSNSGIGLLKQTPITLMTGFPVSTLKFIPEVKQNVDEPPFNYCKLKRSYHYSPSTEIHITHMEEGHLPPRRLWFLEEAETNCKMNICAVKSMPRGRSF